KVLVVHAEQDDRDDTWYGNGPFRMRLIFDIHDLFPLPFPARILPPMDDIGRKCGSDKAMAAVGIVMEPDLQRDQTVLAKVETLLWFLFLEIPEMDFAAVFEMADLLKIETRHEVIGRGPFRGDHHIVARLIPEVVAEFDSAHRAFPAADDLEILVEMQIAAGRIALRTAQHGDDDLGAEAMHGMRCGKIGLGLDLTAFDDFEQRRATGIGASVDNVEVGRAHAGHDQIFPFHPGIAVAGRARIPAHVVKLIPDTRHLETRNHLAVGRTPRIRIYGAQIVRLLDARAGIYCNRIEQFFARRLHRFGGRSIAWSTALF